ncbi:MarR family winged helix-turn-helix transcriptional regulator [Ramlibacter rhizophilus]|uniref:MarR family transcriptional regulator n=1 Tax=Ramlibacter rhizophilus TaxID=1781167 RepID=A0A4Z0C1F1_9BURK|nr:MarR family transcriptional regulator [Ramlibacter rhizophilus]
MRAEKVLPAGELDKAQLERLSQFRWQLRRFLRISEDTSRDAGITVLQYQLMLHTQGFPEREWASVGELAERLQAQPHGVVALVTRCEQAGLVRRRSNAQDRRLVEVHLTAKGRRTLERVALSLESERLALARVAEEAMGASRR